MVADYVHRTVIRPTRHPELGAHMQIFALEDIQPWTECLTMYGEEWWVPKSFEKPVPEQRVLTDEEYHVLHQEYEDAVYSLFS